MCKFNMYLNRKAHEFKIWNGSVNMVPALQGKEAEIKHRTHVEMPGIVVPHLSFRHYSPHGSLLSHSNLIVSLQANNRPYLKEGIQHS